MAEEVQVPLKELNDWVERNPEEMLERSKEFYETIRKRHTIRDYKTEDVPQEVIEECIRAAGTAPNGANHQPWHFVMVKDQSIKQKIREAAEQEEQAFYGGKAGEEWLDALAPIGTDEHKPHLTDAPWLICIFAQKRGGVNSGDDRKNYYVNESVGIATGFLIAALHNAGLATLTHTPNPMKFLNEILGRPASEKPYLILVVGKPSEDANVPEHALKKKPLEEISSIF